MNLARFAFILFWGTVLFEPGLSIFSDVLILSLSQISAVLFLGTFLCSVSLGSKFTSLNRVSQRILFSKEGLIFIVIILFSLTGSFYGPAMRAGVVSSVRLIWAVAVFVASCIFICSFPEDYRRKMMFHIGLLSSIVLLSLPLITFVTGIRFSSNLTDTGFYLCPFDDYNVYNLSLIVAFGLLIIPFRPTSIQDKLGSRLLLLLLLVAFAAAFGFVSGSRRALVFYAPTALLMPLYVKVSQSSRTKIKAAFIVALAFLAVMSFASEFNSNSTKFPVGGSFLGETVQRRMARSLGFFSGDYSKTGREEIWSESLKFAKGFDAVESFFGRGTRSFTEDFGYLQTKEGGMWHPHNFVLSAFLEGGLLKLCLVLVFVLLYLKWLFFNGCKNLWASSFCKTFALLWLFTSSISSPDFYSYKGIFLPFLVLIAYEEK